MDKFHLSDTNAYGITYTLVIPTPIAVNVLTVKSSNSLGRCRCCSCTCIYDPCEPGQTCNFLPLHNEDNENIPRVHAADGPGQNCPSGSHTPGVVNVSHFPDHTNVSHSRVRSEGPDSTTVSPHVHPKYDV